METQEIINKLNTEFIEHLQKCGLIKHINYSKDIQTAHDAIELQFKIKKKDFAFETNERSIFEAFLNKLTNKLYESIAFNDSHKINDKPSLIKILNLKKPDTIYDTILINRELYTDFSIKNKIQTCSSYLGSNQLIFDTWGLNIMPVTSNYPITLPKGAILLDSQKILLTLYGENGLEFETFDHEDTINIKTYFRIDIWETFTEGACTNINSVIKINFSE